MLWEATFFSGATWHFYIIQSQVGAAQCSLHLNEETIRIGGMSLDRQSLAASQRSSRQVWLPNAQVRMRYNLRKYYCVVADTKWYSKIFWQHS